MEFYRRLLFDHKLSLTHRVPFISAYNREVVGSSPTRHAQRGDSSAGRALIFNYSSSIKYYLDY